MTTARCAAFFVVAAVSLADAPSAQQTTARPARIEGVILADDTRLPLANANVRIFGGGAPRTLDALILETLALELGVLRNTEVFRSNPAVFGHDGCALDSVFQFPHIAGPVIAVQRFDRFQRKDQRLVLSSGLPIQE